MLWRPPTRSLNPISENLGDNFYLCTLSHRRLSRKLTDALIKVEGGDPNTSILCLIKSMPIHSQEGKHSSRTLLVSIIPWRNSKKSKELIITFGHLIFDSDPTLTELIIIILLKEPRYVVKISNWKMLWIKIWNEMNIPSFTSGSAFCRAKILNYSVVARNVK